MSAVDPQRPSRHWQRAAGVAVLTLGMLAATYPAWRVMLLGAKPTLEELLRQTCSATVPAGPPDWLIERLARGPAQPAVRQEPADIPASGAGSR